LLDTIGLGESDAQNVIASSGRKSSHIEGGLMMSSAAIAEESKDKAIGADLPSSQLSSLEGSDLATYLESTIMEF
jgi:hypothetical protein